MCGLGAQLGPRCIERGESLRRALARHYCEFDFRHVEPTGVPRRVVLLDAAQRFHGLLRSECFD